MKRTKSVIAKVVIYFLLVLTVFSDCNVYASELSSINDESIRAQQTVSEDFFRESLQTVVQGVYGLPTSVNTGEDLEIDLPTNAQITETVIHPTKTLLYAVDKTNQKVYSVNYKTGDIKETVFDLPPESIAYANNELYVTLLKGQHSSYWWEEDQEGAIAIIDADTMQLNDQVDINIDPCDILADNDGYFYVVSGSGQWTYIKSYSRTSMQEISTATIQQMSSAELNYALNKIYTIDTNGTHCMSIYKISEGRLSAVNFSDSIDYASNKKFRVSPDGKYLFNTSGVITTCDEKSENEKLKVSLSKSYSDVAFDINNGKFYTAVGNKQIYVYDYNTFIGTDVLQSKNNIRDMYYRDNALIALSLTGDNKAVIEQISLSSSLNTSTPALTPTPTPTPSPTKGNGYITIGKNVTKTAINTEKNTIYIIDSLDNTLSSINYLTGERIDKKEFYKPSAVVYSKGNLFVGFGDQGYIGVYDLGTLEMKDQIFTGYNFEDIAIGNDGFLYTAPRSSSSYDSRFVKSFSTISKQEISKCSVSYGGGGLSPNPVENIMYIVNGSFTYENGKISSGGYINNGTYLRNKVSPDGKYVFNASANIYTKDLKFYFKLNKEFNDVAFDIKNNRFFTAIGDKMIYSYDYSTLLGRDTINTEGIVKDLYYSNNKLISVSKLDSGEYVLCTESAEFNATPVPTPTVSETITPSPTPSQWSYNIKDSVFDTEKPCVYFIESSKNILASYNYETEAFSSVQQYYSPTSIDLLGGEVLVGYGNQGMIEIYNTAKLEMKDKIMIGSTFTDFAVGRDGNIYVVTNNTIKSFSRTSKQELNSISCDRSTTGCIQMHPTREIFYLSASSSSNIKMYQYTNGIIGYKDYYKDSSNGYETGNINKISPDGCLVFNDKGGIFVSSSSQNYDLRYITFLSEGGFSDLSVNLENDRIYAASKVAPVIVIYKYSTKKLLGVINTKNVSSSINVRDGNLITLSGQKVEVISEDSASIFPQTSPTPTSSNGIMLPEYSYITDVVSHPSKPYIYSVDPLSGKVILTNTQKEENIETKVDGSPEFIDYYNNEVYASIGDQKKILIFDADTLKYKDCITTTFTFKNFKVGNDGYIYVGPGMLYSRTSKQEISKGTWYHDNGYLIVKNPVNNNIYFSTIGVSPSDINACRYENGQFISSYDSPYHGTYSFGIYNFVSTDGKYIINNTGNIFTSSSDRSKDLKYVTKLDASRIMDIVFDIPKNRFYVLDGSNTILVYNYSTFTKISTIQLSGSTERIFYSNSNLITLSYGNNTRYYYGTVNVEQDKRPDDVIIPNDLFIRQFSKNSISVSWKNNSPYMCMLEYGTTEALGSKTKWEESSEKEHNFIIENVDINTKYNLKIHYMINDEEIQSDVFNFTTSDCASFDIGSEIDRIVYDSLNNKAYGFSQKSMELFILDLDKYQVEKTIVLDEKPADMCLSSDSKRLYVLNCYGTLSVFDTETKEKVEDIPCTLPNWGDNYTHYHIYYNNNKLYLVDGESLPGLWVLDIESKELRDYSEEIYGIGGLVFSSTGKEFYYWYQNGWNAGWAGSNLYKCQIDDLGNISITNRLYVENSGYKDFDRDPLDTPIFLDEEENKLYFKDVVFDINNFKIIKTLSENIYAYAPEEKLIAGTTKMFSIPNWSNSSTLPRTNSKSVFFDKSGNLYMCKAGDTRVFYYKEAPEIIADFNGDKSANSIDFAIFRQYLLEIIDSLPVKDAMFVGDLNRDNNINAVDFAILRGYLLGKFDELPYLK